jgi:hypothetical protein
LALACAGPPQEKSFLPATRHEYESPHNVIAPIPRAFQFAARPSTATSILYLRAAFVLPEAQRPALLYNIYYYRCATCRRGLCGTMHNAPGLSFSMWRCKEPTFTFTSHNPNRSLIPRVLCLYTGACQHVFAYFSRL